MIKMLKILDGDGERVTQAVRKARYAKARD